MDESRTLFSLEQSAEKKEQSALAHALSLIDRQNVQIQDLRKEKVELEQENGRLTRELRKVSLALEEEKIHSQAPDVSASREISRLRDRIKTFESQMAVAHAAQGEAEERAAAAAAAAEAAAARARLAEDQVGRARAEAGAARAEAGREAEDLRAALDAARRRSKEAEEALVDAAAGHQEEVDGLAAQLQRALDAARAREQELAHERERGRSAAVGDAQAAAARAARAEARLRAAAAADAVGRARLEERHKALRVLFGQVRKGARRYKRKLERKNDQLMVLHGENQELKREIDSLLSQHKQVIDRMKKVTFKRLEYEIKTREKMMYQHEADKETLMKKVDHARRSQQLTHDYLNSIKEEVVWHKNAIKKAEARFFDSNKSSQPQRKKRNHLKKDTHIPDTDDGQGSPQKYQTKPQAHKPRRHPKITNRPRAWEDHKEKVRMHDQEILVMDNGKASQPQRREAFIRKDSRISPKKNDITLLDDGEVPKGESSIGDLSFMNEEIEPLKSPDLRRRVARDVRRTPPRALSPRRRSSSSSASTSVPPPEHGAGGGGGDDEGGADGLSAYLERRFARAGSNSDHVYQGGPLNAAAPADLEGKLPVAAHDDYSGDDGGSFFLLPSFALSQHVTAGR